MRRRFQKNPENLLEIEESEKWGEKPKLTNPPPSFYRKNSEKRWNKHLKRKFTFLFASKVHGQPRLGGFFGFFSGFFQETAKFSLQTQKSKFSQISIGILNSDLKSPCFYFFEHLDRKHSKTPNVLPTEIAVPGSKNVKKGVQKAIFAGTNVFPSKSIGKTRS